jgi:dTDP-4-dehydrorhamnose reductase
MTADLNQKRARGGLGEAAQERGEAAPVGVDVVARASASQQRLELWAGAECTVNRVQDQYFDQLQRTGHATRLDDLERLADLGVRRVRFPILWERTAPGRLADADYRWSDVRMQRLAALGIEPIVGLVHHGSGPRHTSLCDEGFAQGLAAFAAQVAARYPWVTAYTPINEPLTTARFSALYGLWYPHARDLGSFLRALVNETLATRASMAAIRRINPRAELYQTEDIGQIFSTADLDQQCRYENERRWLSLDLLFGRVGAEHPLRGHLEGHGVEGRVLDHWCDEPCAPELIGVNYYVTSDRFLDSRLERYPRHTWGGNGRQAYADLEAVRVRPEGILGHRALLESVWQRYRTTCALTEAHLACHREDQLRWLTEAWHGAEAARANGADVRALTLWSVFGAVGWNNLVTSASGDYEPGAYDVRGPVPRSTAIAALARSFAGVAHPEPPLARGDGWWRRETRLSYAPPPQDRALARAAAERVLVVGEGELARRVATLCARRFACVSAPALAGAPGALAQLGQRDAAGQAPPWAVILAFEPARARTVMGPSERALRRHWAILREQCRADVRVLGFSSHRVFDGWSEKPYLESDGTSSVDPEGAGWLGLEQVCGMLSPEALLVRGGLLLDPEAPADLLWGQLETIRQGGAPRLPSQGCVSPTYVPHLVDAALDLLVDGERGVWHLVPRTCCSPFELASRSAERLGLPTLVPSSRGLRRSVSGPMEALASERGWLLPDLDVALDAYTREAQRISVARAHPASSAESRR